MPPRHQKETTSDWFPDKGMTGTLAHTGARPYADMQPLVVAHRGASGHAPENTLAAFLLAAEMGADAIELDVHLTADGEVVVIHNDTVDATTNGQGRVSQMTLDELVSLDAGSWYDARYARERIPTLAGVFETIGPRLLINVEIKVERDRGTRTSRHGQLEAEVVRLIEDYAMSRRVLVSSFSPGSLRRVHKLAPSLPLGLLYAQLPGWAPRLFLRLIRAWVPYDALHPALGWVDGARVTWARRLGLPVNVWTVNAVEDMQRMRDLQVAGIITNYPNQLIQALANQPGSPG